jgi:hypothetical protein
MTSRYFSSLFALFLFHSAVLFSQRSLISKELSRVGADKFITTTFQQFPRYDDREQWSSVPASYKEKIIKNADQYTGFEWPTLKASLFLEFSKTGNRSHYEHFAEMRREILGS